MDKLTSEVKEFAHQVGADLVGIAGRECFSRLPSVRPDELLPDTRSVVVMAVRRNHHVLHPDGDTPDTAEHYMGRIALEMHILLRTSNFLEDKGFEVVPVSHHGHFIPSGASAREAIRELTVTPEGELQGVEAFERVFWERHRFLSHMKLAEEAGMGEIGWCKQLVTPEFGPRVGLVSLVTDAPLEPDKKLAEPVCKKDECSKCVEACPAGALNPYGYNIVKCMFQMGALPNIDLIKRGDKEAIERYFRAGRLMTLPFERAAFRGNTGSQPRDGCGLCVDACPVGSKRQTVTRLHLSPSVVPISREIF